MATREGARALGLEAEIGSIEIGKKADLIIVNTRGLHQVPGDDPYARLVYATRAADVRATIVDGEVVARDGRLMWEDAEAVRADAEQAARTLVGRAGL